jgi:5'-3' exonuclease
MSQSEPDPNATCTKIVDRIRTLAARHPYAAICCDSGKSFRAEIDPNYKAQRPERDATLHHQIKLAIEKLTGDGFPVWGVRGFEADDLIASAVARALAIDGTTVLIASADKDLLQLVGPRVRVISTNNGNQYDAEAVSAKFGIGPELIRDYLTLVGDASDNIIGAKGIGPKRACELLTLFGSLDALYAALDSGEAKLTPSVATSLAEFRGRYTTVRDLITLRADVDIPFAEIAAERTPKDVTPIVEDAMSETTEVVEPAADSAPRTPDAGDTGAPIPARQELARQPEMLPAPAEWGKQLEPRSMGEAAKLANYMHEARLFNGYGTPQAVLSTILAGRELGLNAVASLRGFHIIDGKHALAADAMRALVLRSGHAKYFRCIERTPESATFETWRKDEPEATRMTYTMAQAKQAWSKTEDAWNKSAWHKHPEDMLAARASSKLARLVYADILFGLYAPEELRD